MRKQRPSSKKLFETTMPETSDWSYGIQNYVEYIYPPEYHEDTAPNHYEVMFRRQEDSIIFEIFQKQPIEYDSSAYPDGYVPQPRTEMKKLLNGSFPSGKWTPSETIAIIRLLTQQLHNGQVLLATETYTEINGD